MVQNISGIRYGKVLLGIAILIILFILSAYVYLRVGPVPVAVADPPFPFEKPIVRTAVRARTARENQSPPFAVSEDVFKSGADIYRQHCAMCHGNPGHDAALATQMFPAPPQLWKKHGPHGVVGVSDDDPGFSYWVVSNGIRLTGMPSFSHALSDKERWEVTLLLKNADKPMPPSVSQILKASESHEQETRP
jgi:mono/diheme cytochrome c family protein